jgi:hypothetical protein
LAKRRFQGREMDNQSTPAGLQADAGSERTPNQYTAVCSWRIARSSKNIVDLRSTASRCGLLPVRIADC